MPRVSIIILTKNRLLLLQQALKSIQRQNFNDYEIVVVNDGSTDDTQRVLEKLKTETLRIIKHGESHGITRSRQEALLAAAGDLVAFLDDDDEWVDPDKLVKQVGYFEKHPDAVAVGGGIVIERSDGLRAEKFRPETNEGIRQWMLLKNPFFTSSIMVKRETSLKAGGFLSDGVDLAEDYDLWLRMGALGSFYNFQESFVKYRLPGYNKGKFRTFLRKQLRLIRVHKSDYPHYFIAAFILRIRILIGR